MGKIQIQISWQLILFLQIMGHKFLPKFYQNRRCLFKIRQRFSSVFKMLDKSRKRKIFGFLTTDHSAAHSEGYMEAIKWQP